MIFQVFASLISGYTVYHFFIFTFSYENEFLEEGIFGRIIGGAGFPPMLRRAAEPPSGRYIQTS